MKFKEDYIRKIIQEEISLLKENDDEADKSPVEIDRNEMAQVGANLRQAIVILRPSITASDPDALKSLTDLDELEVWFGTKLACGENSENTDWPSESNE